ncbi:MAG: hypothetical protein EAZ70_11045 [Runella slithyformis]|nr:MAG: hypothetical protein EAY79_11695 [Runella slithyformis]TAF24903.1 MAG: hypothetical protein EAZ70_11045 [Runella slithyformis]TAF48866.1 MAG: hypothetical protein EAZ63_03415 [Runella slithyformis]TAF79761.1 MAG: hypothetical protein EAZ50_10460 [Runella slithyformis]
MLFAPKVFHQIWLGSKPIPRSLSGYSQTWRDKHPDWGFELWDDAKSNTLIQHKYPHWWLLYESLPYLTQRVDIIKYLVLYEFGGVYIDFDCECLKPIDALLTHPACIGLEPRDERLHQEFPFFLGNAYMSAEPKTAFFKATIERCKMQLELLTPRWQELGKYHYVMETTGPTLINRVYHDFEDKENIRLLPPELVGPFRGREATLYRENKKLGYGADKLKDAYAIHHFIGSWL